MSNNISSLFAKLENLEKENTNVPMIFSEILKDEINATDELTLYNNMKAIFERYKNNQPVLYIVNQVIRSLSDGASLEEILNVSIEEAQLRQDNPEDLKIDTTFAI